MSKIIISVENKILMKFKIEPNDIITGFNLCSRMSSCFSDNGRMKLVLTSSAGSTKILSSEWRTCGSCDSTNTSTLVCFLKYIGNISKHL